MRCPNDVVAEVLGVAVLGVMAITMLRSIGVLVMAGLMRLDRQIRERLSRGRRA